MNFSNKIFSSENNNKYIFSENLRYFTYIPDEFQTCIDNNDDFSDTYYARKYRFLKECGFFEKKEVRFKTQYQAEQVRQNLACLRQLLIEVTDSCNLKCKYCGYGEFYSNYDQRETFMQNFDNVKVLIDYLVDLWKSDYNTSFNNVVIIGFYGGEPLLNIKLIKEIVNYVEDLKIENIVFKYNMTTNAVLLNKCMDFLADKKFDLLISLDGDKTHSAYRVDKKGKNSFDKIVSNVYALKEKHPSYFAEHVNFNVVLHDLNSVELSYKAIYGLFEKKPMISELNTNGIIPERWDEFLLLFNSKIESFNLANNCSEVKDAYNLEDSNSLRYHSTLINYSGNWYANWNDFFQDKSGYYIPTGTCRPFERKLFLTVNGKILPCEKVGHKNAIAYLQNGKLNFDCNAVAEYYSSLYENVLANCHKCFRKKECGQCLFLFNSKNGQLVCPGIESQNKLQENLSVFLTYAENNPNNYNLLLSSITVD